MSRSIDDNATVWVEHGLCFWKSQAAASASEQQIKARQEKESRTRAVQEAQQYKKQLEELEQRMILSEEKAILHTTHVWCPQVGRDSYSLACHASIGQPHPGLPSLFELNVITCQQISSHIPRLSSDLAHLLRRFLWSKLDGVANVGTDCCC